MLWCIQHAITEQCQKIQKIKEGSEGNIENEKLSIGNTTITTVDTTEQLP